MLWNSCVCVSGSLVVICTSKAMAWFDSYQPSVLGLQLARMNLRRWPRALNPSSFLRALPCGEYSCPHGARAGLHPILRLATQMVRPPFAPCLFVRDLNAQWFPKYGLEACDSTRYIYLYTKQRIKGQIPSSHEKWNPSATQQST